MADTATFFSEYLPAKLSNPGLAAETGVFQFDIKDAGTWTLDLGAKTVTEGAHAAPGCKITVDKATWEGILDKPANATMAVMTGKMKVTNLGMATKLQKILA